MPRRDVQSNKLIDPVCPETGAETPFRLPLI